MNDTTAFYIHIPYCKSRCGYCDFCSFTDTSDKDAYVEELIRRISGYNTDKRVKSIYFGGGTPTYIGADALCRVLSSVTDAHDVADDCEITVEANPVTIDLHGLKMLRRAGFNRLSAGLQTASETELLSLMRVSHTVSDGETLVRNARAAGFENISLDLMYGIPGQTAESLLKSLKFVLSLDPEHISAYALKLEEGTPLYEKAPVLPDDDTVADMYMMINKELSKNGYNRYEISNFAKPGMYSRHNSRYWLGGDYIGFGVSAASLVGNIRYHQTQDMKGFLSGKAPDVAEQLTDADREAEYIMLHLRLAEGINKAEFKEFFTDFDKKYGKAVEKYVAAGLCRDEDERFYLTDRGVYVSNAIISDLIFE